MTWLAAPEPTPTRATRHLPALLDALGDPPRPRFGSNVRVWPREAADVTRREVPADVVLVEDLPAHPIAVPPPPIAVPPPWRVTLQVSGELVVPIDGPDDPAATRLVAALRRRPDLDGEAFRAHWLGVHGPLNRDTPAVAAHVVRYEQLCCDPAPPVVAGDAPVDGVTVQWFPSPEAFSRFATDARARGPLAADEDRFLDRDRLLWMLVRGEVA